MESDHRQLASVRVDRGGQVRGVHRGEEHSDQEEEQAERAQEHDHKIAGFAASERCYAFRVLPADLLAIASRHRTLEEVVRWGAAQSPRWLVADVITQDEYTHDVVLAGADGQFLVFDTT